MFMLKQKNTSYLDRVILVPIMIMVMFLFIILILLIHKISVRQATKITMRLRQVALILNALRALHRRTLRGCIKIND